MGIDTSVHDRASILRSVVIAANDGVVTTFAVVAGSLGASLSPTVVLILGFANLFADGLSMSTGAYLGVKSEIEFEKREKQKVLLGEEPFKNGATTFVSFVLAGLLPLLPYLFKLKDSFIYSSVLVAATLLAVGILRGVFTGKNSARTAMENLTIGGLAAGVAYTVGFLVDKYLI